MRGNQVKILSPVLSHFKKKDMEIKPQDLRLGNLIGVDDEVASVTAIGKISVYFTRTSGRRGSEHLTSISGIELTPEWLERLGFKQGDNVTSNDSFYVIKLGVSELGINPDNGVCWITNRTGSINNPLCLYFVHQVQNLFYSMTGEELAIDKTSLKN